MAHVTVEQKLLTAKVFFPTPEEDTQEKNELHEWQECVLTDNTRLHPHPTPKLGEPSATGTAESGRVCGGPYQR